MLLMIPDHKLLYEEKTVETRYVYFQTIWKQWIVFNNRQINFSIDMVQYHANIIPKRGGKLRLVPQMVETLPARQETQVRSLGQEGPLEKGMATHSSIFAWKISWTEEPGGL